MTSQTKITYNLKGLDVLEKELGGAYRARVGILGSHAARNDGEPIDNATLGVIQMFGSFSKKIPARDFLFTPIVSHGKEIVRDMAASSKVKAALGAGQFKMVYELLGTAALKVVLEGFETAGFGQWAPNKPSTIRRKKSDRPLIDSSQLRRAQSSDVVGKGEI